MTILVFFLAMFGLIGPGWMLHNLRYSILVISMTAAIITPTTDIMNMCIFVAPTIILYLVSIGLAYIVHPMRRHRHKDVAV